MKLLVTIIRYFVGTLFVISGLIKVNDPVGFSYKLNDYFATEVLNLPSLIPYSLLISILIVVFEVVIGVFLILGYKKKFTLWSLLLMIVFFTFLTFYSAYFNKVTDCGCFGDAIKLTPWQSFTKDIILLVLIVFLLLKNHLLQPILTNKIARLVISLTVFLNFSIIYYVLMHLPIIDFRAYKIGANIVEGMEIPKGAPRSVYEDIWYYKVNGKVNQYTTEDQPWYIEGAEFVDRTTTLITKGYEPPIHDFTIELDGADYTQDVLSSPKVVLIVMYNLNKSEKKGLENLEALHQNALKKGYLVIGLTASLENEINHLKKQNGLTFDFYACDETALKTIVRSNPGILTLNKGTITQKVHWNDINDLNL